MRVLLIVVVALVSTACASTGATPRPFPKAGSDHGLTPDRDPPPKPAPPLVETALALRGTPYRNGGADARGFDCSGFVWYVFGQHGIGMPRTVAEQFASGKKIDIDKVQPGDLLFFRTAGGAASHVGIAIDAATFVHAPSSSGVVRVEAIGSSYWWPRYVGARRMEGSER